MRYARWVVVALLIVSLGVNAVLYQKAKGRPVLRVNDYAITTREWEADMAAHFGPQTLAAIVQRQLAIQASEKAGMKIDEKAIDDAIADNKERNPTLNVTWKHEPYRENDFRQDARYKLAMINLRTKDVRATDEDIKGFFADHPGAWDKQDRIKVLAVQCADAKTADRAEALLKQPGLADPQIIQGNLDQSRDRTFARVVGVDGTMVFLAPPVGQSRDPFVRMLVGLKDKDVRRVAIPNSKALLVFRRESLTPGKVVTLDEVKDKVATAFKLQRSLPEKEILRKLWDAANVQTDKPDDKAEVKWLLFHDAS